MAQRVEVPLLRELNREEARSRAADALLLFPVGATEQHGPHLPVDTDRAVVEHVAHGAAAQVVGEIPVLVAPTMPFGSSHHHIPFGGTMSLSTHTYFRAIYELLESLVASGYRRFFILNGHGGNTDLLKVVARDLALAHDVHVATEAYWTIARDELMAAKAHVPGHLPGHSGAFETSLMLALRPGLVQEPRPHREPEEFGQDVDMAGGYVQESHGDWQRIDGYTDSPDRGRAEDGARYLAAAINGVAAALKRFYQATNEVFPRHIS